MNIDELLVILSFLNNRSLNQTKLLFELCECDFEKLMKVEAGLKKSLARYCPGDKDEIDFAVNVWNKSQYKDK